LNIPSARPGYHHAKQENSYEFRFEIWHALLERTGQMEEIAGSAKR
jgi:hypothetical protein